MSPPAKKHVLLIARHPVGGIRTYFRYVFGRADFADCAFTLITPRSDFRDTAASTFEGKELTYIEVEEKTGALARETWRQLRRGRFDLVHSHGFTAGAEAAVPACMLRVPHLMTAHDVLFESQFAGLSGRVKHGVLNWLYSGIDGIHAVSEDCAQNVKHFMPAIRAERLHPVLNGIDVQRFARARSRDLRSELKVDDGRLLVGFFGRFMAQKGFRYLVDAVEILKKDQTLKRRPLVVTFGAGGFVREEMSAIRERRLEDSFVNLPFTTDTAAAMKGVDIVAMPSLWEACGLVAMEALAAGMPLIGTTCIGLREVLRGTPAMAVPPEDGNALADALRRFIEAPSAASFQQYQPLAIERFDSRLAAEGLRALYDQLIPLQPVAARA
ncbi:MAG TPA: glycosyltransferase family 4 protein [Vicinamibacterales bacterium]|nr:glycosyltransferase family 4 protein [Vicinamibacterales bacterium]